jgi:hypothetical protein
VGGQFARLSAFVCLHGLQYQILTYTPSSTPLLPLLLLLLLLLLLR